MSSAPFTDPRTNPSPSAPNPSPRTTTDPARLVPLERLCRAGRLYDVEEWIRRGEPLQLAPGVIQRGRRVSSAMDVAMETGSQALLLLLLCNGYDPNVELPSPLDDALRKRRYDLLDDLLAWGADPHQIDPEYLFATYDLALFERFWTLGVDFTARHALAYYLSEHANNKPLFGFVKRHLGDDVRFQRDLDMALGDHTARGNEKGVMLCLWAGADPHALVPPLRYLSYGGYDEEDEEDPDLHSALYEACHAGRADLLRPMRPDPARDDFHELYRVASSPEIVAALARLQPVQDDGELVRRHILVSAWPFARWSSTETLRALFAHGARWRQAATREIADVRRAILKLSDEDFIDLMKILTEDDHCSPEILAELGRTQAMRARMKQVGFIPSASDEGDRYWRPRPPRSGEVLQKFGITLPKQERRTWLPSTVRIGTRRAGSQELTMTRAGLAKQVWERPVAVLASEWGISGPGLAKACRRLQIPVPPRGYWAQRAAGRKPRRPAVAALPPGHAEQIVIWLPPSEPGNRSQATLRVPPPPIPLQLLTPVFLALVHEWRHRLRRWSPSSLPQLWFRATSRSTEAGGSFVSHQRRDTHR